MRYTYEPMKPAQLSFAVLCSDRRGHQQLTTRFGIVRLLVYRSYVGRLSIPLAFRQFGLVGTSTHSARLVETIPSALSDQQMLQHSRSVVLAIVTDDLIPSGFSPLSPPLNIYGIRILI